MKFNLIIAAVILSAQIALGVNITNYPVITTPTNGQWILLTDRAGRTNYNIPVENYAQWVIDTMVTNVTGLTCSFIDTNQTTFLFTNGILVATNGPPPMASGFTGYWFQQSGYYTFDGCSVDLSGTEPPTDGTYNGEGTQFTRFSGGDEYYYMFNNGSTWYAINPYLNVTWYLTTTYDASNPVGDYTGGASVSNFTGTPSYVDAVSEDRLSWTDLSGGSATFIIKLNGSQVWSGTGSTYTHAHSADLYEMFYGAVKIGQISL